MHEHRYMKRFLVLCKDLTDGTFLAIFLRDGNPCPFLVGYDIRLIS